jgi:hypothetical protein
MPDFTIRADSVDVEQIMRQIRGRIRDKRGVDYTEEQIRELAAAKLERFLDPTGVRSDLLEQFRSRPSLPPGFLYQFEDTTLFDSDKPIVRFFRRLLHPFLKLLFNPNVLSSTLHKQAAFNEYVHAHQPLQFELLHNLVLELTRASIEVKNLTMRLESVQSRLEFNERRARALEAVVQYKPDAAQGGRGGREDRREARGQQQGRGVSAPQPRPQSPPPQQARAQQPAPPRPQPFTPTVTGDESAGTAATEPQGGVDPITGGESLRTRRRRRRRGRRSGGEAGSTESAADTSADTAEHAVGGGDMASGTAGVAANGTHAHQTEPAHPFGTPVAQEGGERRLEAEGADASHSDSRMRLSADSFHADDESRLKSGTESAGRDAEVRPTAGTTQGVAAADETTLLRRDVTDDPSQ